MLKLWEPTGCWCFSRRTGSLILGTVMMIVSLIVIGLLTYCLVTVKVQEKIQGACSRHRPKWKECENVLGNVVISLISVYMAFTAIQGIFSYMLLHGIWMKMPRLMLPHMILKLVAIIFVILTTVVVGILVLIYVGAWPAVIVFAILFGVWTLLETYFLLVMRAHYIDIKCLVSSTDRELLDVSDEGVTVL